MKLFWCLVSLAVVAADYQDLGALGASRFVDKPSGSVPSGDIPIQNLRGTIQDLVNAAAGSKLKYCNLDGVTLAQKLKYQLEFKALDTDGSGYLDRKDLQMSDTQIESMLNSYLQQSNPNNVRVTNDQNSVLGFGGGGHGDWCCYTRSLSEIASGALAYLQNLGFLPKQKETTINAALVKKVLENLLKSDKTKVNECQFASTMFYAEKLGATYKNDIPTRVVHVQG